MEIEKKNENMYNRGKIYKLTSLLTEDVYVGSTCKHYLSDRLSAHRCDYQRYKDGRAAYVTSYKLFDHGDVDIELLESYPCNSKAELHAREKHWIRNTPNCCNKNIPTRSKKEYQQDRKIELAEYQKVYREDNKQTLSDQHSKYYLNHRDHLKDKSKKHYEENKDSIKLQKKRYYEATKEKLSQNIACDCGAVVTMRSRTKHCKTKKHLDSQAIKQ